jgi:hypothetical protein
LNLYGAIDFIIQTGFNNFIFYRKERINNDGGKKEKKVKRREE